MLGQRRQQRTYDHRLRDLVRETGDLTVATRRGVPRSTAAGWLRAERRDIVTLDVLDKTESKLRADVLKLRHRVRVLGVVVRLLLQLLRMSGFRLEVKRIAPSSARTALLRAVENARELLPLRAVLRLAGISSSRLSSWTAADRDCTASDLGSCPRRTPNQLTADEVITIHELVTPLSTATCRQADWRFSLSGSGRSLPPQRPGPGWSGSAAGAGPGNAYTRRSPRSG
jgi:hypothetical protein